jgi:NitT/TauT family transport system ATP-binding protein
MMFQEHALLPWLSVAENVSFALKHRRDLSRQEKLERVTRALELTGLRAQSAARIFALSGGMKQRLALARTLAPKPEVILFDEPFGALDALTRERLYDELQRIVAQEKQTAVFVTHNPREAACLADRVIVLTPQPGRICGELPVVLPRPRDFYDPKVASIAGEILSVLRASDLQAQQETPQ